MASSWDHPRACGENFRSEGDGEPHEGSSPRVRGKHGRRRREDRRRGIIPARAGKTVVVLLFMSGVPDHPRACGENSGKARDRCRTWGSSPRVRGKLTEIVVSSQEERIIPARAGKTCPAPGGGARARDHPRACGENSARLSSALVPPGSSPRVRGKRPPLHQPTRSPRIIPARAGKTTPPPPRRSGRPDHPRACGENRSQRSATTCGPGSSPRVRGKPARRDRRAPPDRLIPARAGKTWFRRTVASTERAHPRACGENARPAHPPPTRKGSSPRVRGKRGLWTHVLRPPGLIPARAGKTPVVGSPRTCSGAHPRACGENAS